MTSALSQDRHIELNNLPSSDSNPYPSEISTNIGMSTRRRASEESLKSVNSVIVESVNSSRSITKMEPRRDRRDFAIGLILLFVVVLLWTSSNFVTQDLFEEGFDKPFLITYLNTSSFTLYLLPYLYRYWRHGTLKKDAVYGYEPIANEASTHDESAPLTAEEGSSMRNDQETSTLSPGEDNLPPLTTRETAALASIFCFLWFIANWSVNASLSYTSVGSSTVLASTSGLFTMIVGRVLGIESLSLWKIIAVTGSFFGVLLVSLADTSASHPKTNPPPASSGLPPPSNPLLGDFLALISAAFYALYLSLLKVRIKTEERVDMQLFFGFVGLFNILGCWPMGLFLHLTGIEPLEWPVGGKEWAGIAVNMAVTFSSDFIYVIAMLKTTPLVVTLGLTLTIPLAILGDLILQSRAASLEGLCGAILVIAAFAIVGYDEDTRGVTQVEPVIDIRSEEERTSLTA